MKYLSLKFRSTFSCALLLSMVLISLPATYVHASLSSSLSSSSSLSQSSAEVEHKIKAAFIYNFIKFVTWPDEKDVSKKLDEIKDSKQSVQIAVVGEHPFLEALESLSSKKVNGRAIKIIQISGLSKVKTTRELKEWEKLNEKKIKSAHILYVCESEKKELDKIIEICQSASVLTVSDIPDFIEKGGLFGFVTEDKKVKFEVNLIATNNEDLKISSQLLRLARRVIKTEE